MKITHYDDHRPLRAAAYPDVGDQLDALWKEFEKLGTTPVTDMLARIQAVKAKYPKAPDVE